MEVCNTSSKFVTNIYNYIDSLPSIGDADIEETKEELIQTLKKKFDVTFRQ